MLKDSLSLLLHQTTVLNHLYWNKQQPFGRLRTGIELSIWNIVFISERKLFYIGAKQNIMEPLSNYT